MNWGNYIKRTAIRRVVWVVVGLLVYAALDSFGVVHAQEFANCYRPSSGSAECPDEGTAYAEVYKSAEYALSNAPVGFSREVCRLPAEQHFLPGGPWLRVRAGGISPTTGECSVNLRSRHFPADATCSAAPGFEVNTNVSLHGPPAAFICQAGCEFKKKVDPPGLFCGLVEEGPNVGYWCNSSYSTTGDACTGGGDGTVPGDGADPLPQDPNAPPIACGNGEVRLPTGECSATGSCPLGQHEVNGACQPVGNCPAGHVKAPDGSCAPESCPVNYVRGPDGTCKVDQNNDGTPDEDEPGGDGDNPDGNRFSGGDSCAVPPTCSGDAIMCGQARIQWRIDCNTRTASGATGGDHCDGFNMPICVGEHCDPVEQKQLILQWRATCALESLVNQEGNGEGDGGTATIDVGGIGEGAVDGASGTIGDGGDPGEAFSDGSEGGGGDGELDTAGLGFGTSCPALPVVNVLGVTLDFNEIGPELCDWMSLGGYIVLILSSLLSLRILAGGMNV